MTGKKKDPLVIVPVEGGQVPEEDEQMIREVFGEEYEIRVQEGGDSREDSDSG